MIASEIAEDRLPWDRRKLARGRTCLLYDARPWMLIALGLFAVSTLVSTWRWHLLLEAQGIHMS